MKQIYFKIIFLLCFVFVFTDCSKNNNSDIELTQVQQMQINFSLENFDNFFIKDNLVIEWDDFNLSEHENQSVYEFNTSFKVANAITNGKIELIPKYKLLVFKNDLGNWNYELLKFLSINDRLTDDLSYFNPVFSGTLYHYNLEGKTLVIKAYKDGQLLNEYSDNENNNVMSKLDPIDGTGYYQRICEVSYTDWYSVYDGIAHYTHSVKMGESCDWIYVAEGNSVPGGYNFNFHNHYDGIQGLNGTNNNANHNNEVILNENEDDPCKNIKLQIQNPNYTQQANELKGKTGQNKETGYKQNKDGSQVPLTAINNGHSLNIPVDANTVGYMHTHLNDYNTGKTDPKTGWEIIEQPIRMFSPADVIKFLQIVKNTKYNGVPTQFTYGTMISSSGNYTLRFTGDVDFDFSHLKPAKDYEADYEKIIKEKGYERGFLNFLKDFIKVDGIELYRIKNNNEVEKKTLNSQGKIVTSKCL